MITRSIYPDELAAAMRDRAGWPYQPANGTEGMIFMDSWCSGCVKDSPDDHCPIIAATMSLRPDDPSYPKEWTYGEDGQPKCTAHAVSREAAERCPHTADLFGGCQ